jgi:hypothetical protein
MATNPTNNPIPSEDPRDLKFNAGKIDEEVNGSADYYTDRFGAQRLTNSGRNKQFQDAQNQRESDFNDQMTQQNEDWTEQFNDQKTRFNEQLVSQENEFVAQITDQRDEFNDMLAASGYSWLPDYVDGPVTFTNRSQVTVYNGVAYRLAASTPIGFTTTGTDATSWENDSQYLVAIGDNDIRQQIQYQLGQWLPDAVSIFNLTTDYSAIRVRGFYSAYDGGAGIWIKTGNTDLSKAGTHVVDEAKIYNANGLEYELDVSYGEISVLSNGAKSYSFSKLTDRTTDNFVCLGQVINGIQSHMTLGVSSANNINTYDGGKRVNIIVPTNDYRIGKKYAKLYSGVSYYLNASRIFVFAGASYTFAATGKRLNGFQHGVDEITEKWLAVNQGIYGGSVSLQNVDVYGGTLFGDHTIQATRDECSSGVGILVLNPEGFSTHGTIVRETFMWAMVEMTAEVEATEFNQNGHAFDNDSIDYKYIVDAWVDAGITSRFGNFNRTTHYNSKFMGGRRGTYRNGCDWSALENCEVTNRMAWRNAANVSGDIPEYIAVCSGTVLKVSGGYWSPAATKDYNARYGTVYSTAQNHSFDAVYTEWTYNFLTVSAWGFNGKASRLAGLHINLLSQYKDNFTEYSSLRFEGGCFPTTDDGGNSTYPDGFTHYDTPNGVTQFAWGTPIRDLGAFRHGGFDFKYGPYNVYVFSGTDWDSIRNRPYAKEMFNANGLQVNAKPVMLPWQNPSVKSHVCIWYKDHSGNFNPRNIYAWITAAAQDGPNTDEALYKSFAEHMFDFGNGTKMAMIPNKRLTAWDGLYTYARNCGVMVNVPADGSTPITLIAVEAYQGGVPLFPAGCGNYTPETNGNSVLSPVTNPVGLDSSLGGGLFFPGDIIGPWSHVRRTQSGYIISQTLTSGYMLDQKMVTGGCTLEAAFKVAFSATVETVNSNATTIISIPAAYLPYVAVGIPLYITGGSSTGVTGQVRLIKRLLNSDGTSSNRYLVQGNTGAVGDTLTVDQAQVPAYTFYNDRNFNAVIANSVTVNGISVAKAHRSSVSAGIGYNGASGVKAMEWYFNGGTTPSHRVVASSASGMVIEAAGNLSVVGKMFPSADGTYSLGTSSNRWSQVFATNSTIATSNRDKKTNIRQISPVEVAAFYEIAMLNSVWQWMERYQVEGDDARLHSGPTVQDAIEIMDKYGLDWTQYSAFCYDKWDAQDAVIETWEAEYETIPGTDAEYDEEGNLIVEAVPEVKMLVREAGSKVVEPASEAGEDYAFRKEELLFWISRATIAKQQDIEKRLAAIEANMSS